MFFIKHNKDTFHFLLIISQRRQQGKQKEGEIIKAAADKEARERLQKLANGNVSDSDTSLFDSHFSYENKETKSEVQKEDEFKSFIAKANSKRQGTNANPPAEAGGCTKIRGITIDLTN